MLEPAAALVREVHEEQVALHRQPAEQPRLAPRRCAAGPPPACRDPPPASPQTTTSCGTPAAAKDSGVCGAHLEGAVHQRRRSPARRRRRRPLLQRAERPPALGRGHGDAVLQVARGLRVEEERGAVEVAVRAVQVAGAHRQLVGVDPVAQRHGLAARLHAEGALVRARAPAAPRRLGPPPSRPGGGARTRAPGSCPASTPAAPRRARPGPRGRRASTSNRCECGRDIETR